MDALGRHILVEYYGASAEVLDDVHAVETHMIRAAELAGSTIIQSVFHHFSPLGVSGVVVIQESHLAIHTWPEVGYAAVDIFTCGSDIDPWPAYHHLKELLKADHSSAMELLRGQSSLFPSRPPTLPSPGIQPVSPSITPLKHSWFTSRDEYLALSLKHSGERIALRKTPHQKIEVYDTLAYGRMLVLDGRIVFTEKDEYIYHEMIVHVAMQTVGEKQNILVMGGGDGGIPRELSKYRDISQITVVELDAELIDVAEKVFHTCQHTLFQANVNLQIEDGVNFVQQAEDEIYDVIIVDFVRSETSNVSFYAHLHRLLSPNGVLIIQSEAPRFTPKKYVMIHQELKQIFGQQQVHPYLAYIPTYPTGTWSFAYCSKGDTHPINSLDHPSAELFSEAHSLRYYNIAVHQAAFALPNDLKRMTDDR